MAKLIQEIEAELNEAMEARREALAWVSQTWKAEQAAERELRVAKKESDRAVAAEAHAAERVRTLMAEAVLQVAEELYEEEL